MADTIVITKLQNGNVKVVDSARARLGITYPPDFFIEPLGDGETVAVFRSVNNLAATFRAIDVEKVVRQDGSEQIISDQATLYQELEENLI